MSIKYKLKWKKVFKNFKHTYGSWYAISPINDFVFIAKDQSGQWSNHIIYKKHLNSIKDVEVLNVDDLHEFETQHNLIDCASHTLGCSKNQFQRYVDNYPKYKKHGFDFYTLKNYVKSNKGK
tara:strand:+ start:357 stop:722 length:366 start_codon:yes stop_codon:yes gene_type:complete